MIVYDGVKTDFLKSCEKDTIAIEIEENILAKLGKHTPKADEPRGRGSWFISRRIVSPNDPLTPSPQVHSPDENEVWDNVLKDKIRPDWDAGLLHGIGFVNVDYDRDIIEDFWDDKEKCIYENTPMFMIRAEKQ